MYTTKTEISDETTSYYDRTLLERLLPLMCYTKFGQVRDIPAKSGSNTIKFMVNKPENKWKLLFKYLFYLK